MCWNAYFIVLLNFTNSWSRINKWCMSEQFKHQETKEKIVLGGLTVSITSQCFLFMVNWACWLLDARSSAVTERN